MKNIEKISKEFTSNVFKELSHRKNGEYKWFIRGIHAFRYLIGDSAKGKLLGSYYAFARHVDDIVDGDVSLPQGYKSSQEYVEKRLDFSQKLSNPTEDIDVLLLYCFQLAEKAGFTINQENQDILLSLLFDSKRYGKRIIFDEATLHEHFSMLDIRGTINGTLKFFDEDFSLTPFLEPLGLATRIHYNLRDYGEDIAKGFINIPGEDLERYDLGIRDINDINSTNLKLWFEAQATKGNELLDYYKKTFSPKSFGTLANLALKHVYEIPARKDFNKILGPQTQ